MTPERTLEQVKSLHRQVERPNLFIKIPGTPEGLPAIEEAIFAGMPINVTLLFSARAVSCRRRGVSARHRAPDRGRAGSRDVVSVASVFISRWDKAVQDRVPGRAPRPAGHRHRGPDLSGLPRAARPRLTRRASPPPVPGTSGCSGPAPAPRIPRPPTCSTSRRWPRPTPSTPCPMRRCSPLPITVRFVGSCRRMGATPKSVLAEFERAGIDVAALGRAAPAGRRRGVRQVVECSCWSGSRPSRRRWRHHDLDSNRPG